MKNLIYFASGPIKRIPEEDKFERIVFVDQQDPARGRSLRHYPSQYEVLHMDAMRAVDHLKAQGAKFTHFVILNEGLYEGGGTYPLNSDFFWGYAMPIMTDTVIHVMDPTFYGPEYKVTLDWPYTRTELTESDPDYVSPYSFSRYGQDEQTSRVYRLERTHKRTTLPLSGGRSVHILHDSIWNWEDKLDLIAIKSYYFGLVRKHPKVVAIDKPQTFEILANAIAKQFQRIGFTPWKDGKYSALIEKLDALPAEFPKEFYFFHMNHEDYHKIHKT